MRHLVVLTLLISLISCLDDPGRKPADIKRDDIFFDYKVRGEETDSDVTVYIQFRSGGPNGRELGLAESEKLQLDNDTMSSASAKLTGTYYEIRKPLDQFNGRHAIVFTDENDRQYREDFEFHTFRLKPGIPRVVPRRDLKIGIDGLRSGDPVHVSLTDTSFITRDIVEIDTVSNGQISIAAEKLKNLTDGPVVLVLSHEMGKPVSHGTKAGGRIIVGFGLQRVFELKGEPVK